MLSVPTITHAPKNSRFQAEMSNPAIVNFPACRSGIARSASLASSGLAENSNSARVVAQRLTNGIDAPGATGEWSVECTAAPWPPPGVMAGRYIREGAAQSDLPQQLRNLSAKGIPVRECDAS